MLSSSNQYLRPEYLTPLPTTLDAKKSPLALLAQTCSQIGADSSNSKLLQSSDKSYNKAPKSDLSGDKSSSTASDSVHKSNLKYDSTAAREKSKTPEDRSSLTCPISRVRTPATSKSISSGRSSNQSIHSPGSPNPLGRNTPTVEANNVESSVSEKDSERNSPESSLSCTAKTAFTPSILTSSSDPAIKDLPLGTFKPGVPSSSTSFLGYTSTGFSMPIDMISGSLMSHPSLKSGLSPYLGYGRMKTSDSLSSVCRDPFCAGCSVSSHLIGVGSAVKTPPCSAGCTQCDHAKSPTSTGYIGQSPTASAYAHAQLAALAAASHLPFVCNWISGDASYCGKRFSSSEDLLSHLRTHTSGTITETSSHSMLNSSGLPPTHPLFHRTYPTPPLSPLATARYHPYNKPSLLHPSLSSSSLSGFSLTHPSLSPYLSPYSLYGPRIGTAPGMHP